MRNLFKFAATFDHEFMKFPLPSYVERFGESYVERFGESLNKVNVILNLTNTLVSISVVECTSPNTAVRLREYKLNMLISLVTCIDVYMHGHECTLKYVLELLVVCIHFMK